ncbi:hypothetical protein ACG9XL_17240 [Acinetobacter nosocomialis]|uniref:hypothetical protein n=1 Tax=Acinetobacter calcoaceticus/baumannii complex TaxID=909768 RepID=UPI00233E8371|nr:hypothetical protein [Acinetobacter baumannii]MDC5568438.1 hypothetical protein [Acinetobacter baumannii]MDK2172844.1 hypothetical protein [Acinetobacter baumannii]MDK2183704.1 hypothetical protein [Acinetobacter baumannii]MDK2329528.1 hypothetical protein [Acinetobacter baumannii]
MKKSLYKEVVFGLVMALVGSALWAVLSNYIGPALVAFAIKISSTINGQIYLKISTHDLIALQQSTYTLLTIFFVILLTLIITACYYSMILLYEKYNDSKNSLYKLRDEILSTEKEKEVVKEEEVKSSIENTINNIEKKDKSVRKIYLATRFFFPVAILAFIFSAMYTTLTSKYIYEAISYYDYLINVNASNLDDKTEKEYMSRFMQIRNSNDYHSIVVELEARAFAHGLSILPNPSIRKDEDIRKDFPTIKSVEAGERKKIE